MTIQIFFLKIFLLYKSIKSQLKTIIIKSKRMILQFLSCKNTHFPIKKKKELIVYSSK